MNRRAFGASALLATLAACTPPPQPDGSPAPVTSSAVLPPDSIQGAGDPARAAIIRAASAFGQPGALVGRPATAARAIADVEFLTVELTGPRWVNLRLSATQMAAARPEWRSALGIPPNAPPQALIDSLYAVRRALMAGRPDAAAAALPPGLFSPGGGATLERLANLPPLPQTAAAVAVVEREAARATFDNNRGRPRR